jgi:hypothetical protein
MRSMAVPAGPRACPPCPCPTRLRRARRPPAHPRSGRAASCAAGMANHRTRARHRRCQAHRGHPVRRPSADRATSTLRREIRPEGPGFSSEFAPVRPLGHTSRASVTRPLPRSTGPERFCTTYRPTRARDTPPTVACRKLCRAQQPFPASVIQSPCQPDFLVKKGSS